MDIQLIEDVTLSATEVDANGMWKPSAILLHMQTGADIHCTALGFPRERLVRAGMCWILYRVAYQLYEKATMGDRIRTTTWPGKLIGPIFPRYFSWEKEGRCIGEAMAAWVLIDIEKRRILRPGMLPAPLPTSSRKGCLALPGALKIERCAPREIRRVRFTDLDINGHMNNARYADWISDLYDGRPIKSLQVNYLSEALQGEDIALECPTPDLVAGIRRGDDKVIFEARALTGS